MSEGYSVLIYEESAIPSVADKTGLSVDELKKLWDLAKRFRTPCVVPLNPAESFGMEA